MQLISLNGIGQAQHGTSKAVDIKYNPDPIIYAPEDCTFDSFMQRGTPNTTNDAGLALRVRGVNGLHQFGHMEKTILTGGSAKRGQAIGVMGHTGYTIPDGPAGAHCHWWIQRPDGSYVYPPSIANEAFIKLGGGNMTQDGAEKFVTQSYRAATDVDPTPAQAAYWVERVKANPNIAFELPQALGGGTYRGDTKFRYKARHYDEDVANNAPSNPVAEELLQAVRNAVK